MALAANTDSMRWIPLESNPEARQILNSWSSKAGLDTTLFEFGDVYGLDSDLLGMVPQPCKALLLLFPLSAGLEEKRRQDEQKLAEAGPIPNDPTIFFIKQSIENACGTIGLLHAIINSNVVTDPVSAIAQFRDAGLDKLPVDRGTLLESTSIFADIHAEAANDGQSIIPPDLDSDLHFTCFVACPASDGSGKQRLIELDGRRSCPMDRGECTDLLQDAAKFILDYYVNQSSSMHFSLTALGPPQDF